jgi:hypothetical protein
MSGQEIVRVVNTVAAASLGASFYVLRKTEPFLINRSFDPKFNGVYILRFITGIVGGIILAAAIGPSLRGSLGSGTGANLTPGVLALLGGFSVEAVEEVLQRLVDVLLALVRGDGSAQAEDKAEASQAKKTSQALEDLADLEVKIRQSGPPGAPGGPTAGSPALEALNKVRAALKSAE